MWLEASSQQQAKPPTPVNNRWLGSYDGKVFGGDLDPAQCKERLLDLTGDLA